MLQLEQSPLWLLALHSSRIAQNCPSPIEAKCMKTLNFRYAHLKFTVYDICVFGNTKCKRVAAVNIVLMGVTTPCVHFLWLCLQLEPCVTRPDLATQDEAGIQKYHWRACWFLDLPPCARPCLFPTVLYCHKSPTKLCVSLHILSMLTHC